MEEYKVLKVLGEGSFGRALLVHHRISDQKYAMKEIRLPMVSLACTSPHPPLKKKIKEKNHNSECVFETLNMFVGTIVY